MRVLVYQGPKSMSIEEWEVPRPKAGEVRVKSHMVGICGSDVHGYLGITGRRIAPMVMGHELSGEVTAIGEGVSGIHVGERVTVQPILNCGHCNYCKEGYINICPNREFLGVMQCNGALAEEFCVPAKNICKLPDSISFEIGALIEPFAVGYRAVQHAMPVKGKTAMICGSGTIGLMVLKVLIMLGIGRVIMVDLANSRLELAKRHGANLTINPAEEAMDKVFESPDLKNQVDITFEVVGVTPTVQQTVDYVRNRGQIVWVGNSAPMVTLNMQKIVTCELNIQGTYVYTQKDFEDCIAILATKPVDFSGIVSRIVGLEEAISMFELLSHGAGANDLIKVLVDMTN